MIPQYQPENLFVSIGVENIKVSLHEPSSIHLENKEMKGAF